MTMPSLEMPKVLAFVAGVGSSNRTTAGAQQVRVSFPQPLAAGVTPVVAVTPLQGSEYAPGSIPDTFALTITGINNTGFTVNIWRVDNGGKGWGQNLRLSCLISA
ncbi:hypothetical protein [Musicola paradisiaca]|uniref:Uncharacterized protein n=1 Tax=Musicola paradisiaca (strain Ech703) TaxID=579405 RepID=C6C835_MUSP7|nr:hypothetical protein [Musicola paradisiaca]ACS84180.1 hypothetical protein Dd703_0366 [Musicola paradisiaca Ech703]